MMPTTLRAGRGRLPALLAALVLAVTLSLALSGCDGGSDDEESPPPLRLTYTNDDFVPELTDVPSFSPTSLAVGGTVQVTLPVDSDVDSVQVNVGPYLGDGIQPFGTATQAAAGGGTEVVSVTLDVPGAAAGTYYAQVFLFNGASPHETHYNPTQVTGGTYGRTQHYNSVEVDSYDTGVRPPSFAVNNTFLEGTWVGDCRADAPNSFVDTFTATGFDWSVETVSYLGVTDCSVTGETPTTTSGTFALMGTLTTTNGFGDAFKADLTVVSPPGLPAFKTIFQVDGSVTPDIMRVGNDLGPVDPEGYPTELETDRVFTKEGSTTPPGGGGSAQPVSTTYASPSVVPVNSPSLFSIAAGSVGYLTFTTATDIPYGVYLTDLTAGSNPSTMALNVTYDNAGSPVEINDEGRSLSNGYLTTAFLAGATLQTYVVEVDNSGGGAIDFAVTVREGVLGGVGAGSAVALAVSATHRIGGTFNNGFYEFDTAEVTAQLAFSELTAWTDVTVYDSTGAVIATGDSLAAGTTIDFNLVDLNLTGGPPYRFRVNPNTTLTGVPSVGQVTITSP